jgi:hypothetical protein
MSFMAGVLVMWLMLGTISQKPMKLWLPIGGIITSLILTAIRRWTDLPEGSGWSEGFLVGGLTGALVLQLLTQSSKKKLQRESGQRPSNQEDSV